MFAGFIVPGLLRFRCDVGTKAEWSVCGRRGVVMAAGVGSVSNPYKITVLNGDGIGPQMATVAVKVLQAIEDYTDLHFAIERVDFGEPSVQKYGVPVTDEVITKCKNSDAVLKSYQGGKRDTPEAKNPHALLASELQVFAQLLPVRIYPQLVSLSPFNAAAVDGMDVLLVREISGGFLRDRDQGVIQLGDADEVESFMRYEKYQVDRFAKLVLALAEKRSGKIINVDRANVFHVSQFWRRELHATMSRVLGDRNDIDLSDINVDDFCRSVVLNPRQFDVVCTSNLFGDVISEILASIAGPARLSPTSLFTALGLSIHGPADEYNASAYLESNMSDFSRGPISMIRATSMLLRYGLDEPAAADLIEQAMERSLEESVTPRLAQLLPPGELKGRKVIDADSFTDSVISSLQFMRQFEMVCDPVECGE